MENIKVTVIVPVYNIEELLERCVRSITGQTWKDLEILLIDDGSTDHSGAICDELAKEDSRIHVVHKGNGGSSSARNFGIHESTGDYLCFVDSDDYIEPDMVEKMVSALEDGISMVQIARDERTETGEMLPFVCIPPGEKTFYTSEEFLKELLLHKGDASFCTKLVKREVLKWIAGDNFKGQVFPEGELNEDFHLMLQALPKISGVLSLPDVGYHVWYRVGSNTRKKNRTDFSRVYRDNIKNADLAGELVAERYPALRQVALRFGLFQRLDYLLHIPVNEMYRKNWEYTKVVSYLRTHKWEITTNPYLTVKNRVYLWLFILCPRGIRVIHKKIKRL